MNLRGTIISYASRRKKGMIDKEKKIEEKINELERSNMCTNNVHNNLVTLKEELEDIRKEKMKGVIIRTKARWIEDGEKPSKYFCALEKKM